MYNDRQDNSLLKYPTWTSRYRSKRGTVQYIDASLHQATHESIHSYNKACE